MPARRKRAGKALSATKGAAAKLVDLCLDMEDPLNEALDAAHALRLIGYALREVGNERDARAVARQPGSRARGSKRCSGSGKTCSGRPRGRRPSSSA
jgi:hypothetical protein